MKFKKDTDPGHETVCSCSFFVLENDVWVVVGNEFFESRVVSGNLALLKPRGSDGVLRDVGHMLHENERGQLPMSRYPSSPATPSRTTRRGRGQEKEDKKDTHHLIPEEIIILTVVMMT